MNHFLFKILKYFLVLFFSILLLEILSAYLLKKLPAARQLSLAYASKNVFPSYANLESKIVPRLRPHPYTLYELTPNYSNSAGLQHNSLGYRDHEFDLNDKRKKILILGGSTTYSPKARVIEEAWPKQLEILLAKNGKEYNVINGGVDSASSPEILIAWLLKHQFLKPDIVILHMGVNDTWPVLLQSKYDAEYRGFREPNSQITYSRNFLFLLSNSNFIRFLYAAYIVDDNSPYPYFQNDAQFKVLKENLIVNDNLAKISSTYNIGFERNLSSLAKSIRSKNIQLFFVAEPIAREDRLSLGGSPILPGLENIFEAVFKGNKKIAKTVTEKEGGRYLEINDMLIPEKLFTDNCHLTPEGEKLKAKLIYEKLNLYI
jgi:lysophospholipase L1-like esterase